VRSRFKKTGKFGIAFGGVFASPAAYAWAKDDNGLGWRESVPEGSELP